VPEEQEEQEEPEEQEEQEEQERKVYQPIPPIIRNKILEIQKGIATLGCQAFEGTKEEFFQELKRKKICDNRNHFNMAWQEEVG
jgi:hypothetical protein